MADVFVYAGPSRFGAPEAILRSDRHVWLPPVRRGDIDLLMSSHPETGVIVVCDGVFHSTPAVSHAELLRAIDAGWDVWGTSSIGAIRAHELRHDGMHGFGYVHALFDRHTIPTDDEMCLLHLPEPPYFPASEALVNLRFAFEASGPASAISKASAARVLRALKSLWFGDRTVECMRATMIDVGGIDAATTDLLLAWLELNRVKTADLTRLLVDRPWSA